MEGIKVKQNKNKDVEMEIIFPAEYSAIMRWDGKPRI